MRSVIQQSGYFVDRRAFRIELLAGVILFALGLIGVIEGQFLGISLSAGHGLFFSLTGITAIWGAISHNSDRAFYISLLFGFIFALLAIVGPYLNNMFTRMDHLVHFAFSTLFIYIALTWKRY